MTSRRARRFTWIGFIALAAFCGCARIWRPVDASALKASKPRSLLVVRFPSENFMGPHRNPLIGGMMGVVAQAAEGHNIYERHHLVDPAKRIGDEVGERFARLHGLRVQGIDETHPPPPKRSQVVPPPPAPRRPAADLTLEVESGEWGLSAPLLGNAAIYYGMRAKVIDNRTGRVIADGECRNADSVKAQEAAKISYDRVFDDDAAFIKRQLTLAEDGCVSEIGAKLLLVPPVPATPAAPVAPVPAVDGGAGDAVGG